MEAAVPHKNIIQALSELFEPKDRLEDWKNKINKTVYPNGQLIADVIQDAELVIGRHPDLIGLAPRESKKL